MNPVVKFRRTHKDAKVPTYAKPGDAGMDLCSVEDVTIYDGMIAVIPLGLQVEIPDGFEGQIRMRSGLARCGFHSTTNPGTIDSGYRGDISMLMGKHRCDDSKEPAFIPAGTRVCQLIIAPVARATMVEVDELSASERGTGGFGSTGT